jgi:methylene-tetrahydromethanopterin dehydrogenase
MERAKAAMVPPFAMSLFADPAGSFTTAAAMVAGIDRTLRERKQRELKGTKIAVFGATGPLGFSVAVIAALECAVVTVVGYDGIKRVTDAAAEIKKRFGVDVFPADGSDEPKKEAIVAELAPGLLVAVDANAVPPAGIEGLDAFAKNVALTSHGAFGIGPLAMGDIKYKTESGLFGQMIAADKPVQLAVHDAYVLARQING